VENEKKKGRGASSDFLGEHINTIYILLQNFKSGVMLSYPLSSTVLLFYSAFQCFRKFNLVCSTVLIELSALCLQLTDETSHAMLNLLSPDIKIVYIFSLLFSIHFLGNY